MPMVIEGVIARTLVEICIHSPPYPGGLIRARGCGRGEGRCRGHDLVFAAEGVLPVVSCGAQIAAEEMRDGVRRPRAPIPPARPGSRPGSSTRSQYFHILYTMGTHSCRTLSSQVFGGGICMRAIVGVLDRKSTRLNSS